MFEVNGCKAIAATAAFCNYLVLVIQDAELHTTHGFSAEDITHGYEYTVVVSSFCCEANIAGNDVAAGPAVFVVIRTMGGIVSFFPTVTVGIIVIVVIPKAIGIIFAIVRLCVISIGVVVTLVFAFGLCLAGICRSFAIQRILQPKANGDGINGTRFCF